MADVDSGSTSPTGASPVIPVRGLVAVLDALGTKLLSVAEAIEFVRLRDSIKTFTLQVIETGLPGLDLARLKTFTFNDSLIYTYATVGEVTLDEVQRFCHILRVAETRSIVEKHPFRGALAVGEFFIGDASTVLGPAISDASDWFEIADWIGIHATPHASMFIQSLLERTIDTKAIDHVLVDYDVPLKSGTTKLKAINWPKGFYINGVRPEGGGTTRGLVLGAFAKRRVTKTTESKYVNSVAFFDFVERVQNLERKFTKSELDESTAPTFSASPAV